MNRTILFRRFIDIEGYKRRDYGNHNFLNVMKAIRYRMPVEYEELSHNKMIPLIRNIDNYDYITFTNHIVPKIYYQLKLMHQRVKFLSTVITSSWQKLCEIKKNPPVMIMALDINKLPELKSDFNYLPVYFLRGVIMNDSKPKTPKLYFFHKMFSSISFGLIETENYCKYICEELNIDLATLLRYLQTMPSYVTLIDSSCNNDIGTAVLSEVSYSLDVERLSCKVFPLVSKKLDKSFFRQNVYYPRSILNNFDGASKKKKQFQSLPVINSSFKEILDVNNDKAGSTYLPEELFDILYSSFRERKGQLVLYGTPPKSTRHVRLEPLHAREEIRIRSKRFNDQYEKARRFVVMKNVAV